MEKNHGRILLGDDMGLGKTLQILGYLALHPEISPVIIACPSGAKYEWEAQIYEHTEYLECQVLEGQKPYPITSGIVIINYEILPFWESSLRKLNAKALIMDECHYLKNRKIRRTKICKALSRRAKIVIPLSGTPILSRPMEFFPVLNMLYPKEFNSFWDYAFEYCKPKKGFKGRGWDFRGASNTSDLHERIKPFMLRRMKDDVLKELPPKQRNVIPIDIDNRREYLHAKKNFLDWYGKNYGEKRAEQAKKAEGFVKLGQLKRLAALGKLKETFSWVDDFLESNPDRKIVLWCYHKKVFDALVDRYSKISAIGGKKGRKRHEEVQRFQKDKRVRIFIARIKTDKEAITLTAADTALFIEMGWTPGEHEQAEDRIRRIGQTSDRIQIYYILAHGTLDEYVWDLIEQKRKILGQILDGKEYDEEMAKLISIRSLMKNLYSGKEMSWHRRKAA